jgi:hypothetical protein
MVLCRNCKRFEQATLSGNGAYNIYRGLCIDCIHMKRRLEEQIINISNTLNK